MQHKTKENYLKNMYLLSDEEGNISMSELGKRMAVSIPTVNSMVKRLQEEGLVEYEKYKPLKLTADGEKHAAHILRKHRIAEVFLLKIMGFSWEEVHDIAEDMEHVSSDLLFDRMDEMLDHPDKDPHGSPIPGKDGKMMQNCYPRLSDLEIGQQARLCALVNSTNEFLVFLNKKGIALGDVMKVLVKEPFDKSMHISYKGHKNVTISGEVCDRLLVEIVTEKSL
ncbi:MAG: metal-dependent transcriptional regulator [Bacteroidales bacterium]|nr:metal-dependent transcriptional regulator [Bacteroidales bacterium]